MLHSHINEKTAHTQQGAYKAHKKIFAHIHKRALLPRAHSKTEKSEKPIVTNDIVEINANNEFKILGRKDNVINSGGIKIQIEEVEKIVGKHLNNSFAISGKKNIMYGEIVVLYYTPSTHFSQEILTAINNELPKYHKIKEAVCIDEIPLTSNRKIDRGIVRNR